MPLRHAFALLVLVVAPLIVIGWLGTAAVRRQQRQAIEQVRGLRLERLRERTAELHAVIEQYAKTLGTALQEAGRDPSALRKLRRSQPSIRSVLLVDRDGRLIEPPAPPPENRSAVAWHGALGELARRRPVFVEPEPDVSWIPVRPSAEASTDKWSLRRVLSFQPDDDPAYRAIRSGGNVHAKRLTSQAFLQNTMAVSPTTGLTTGLMPGEPKWQTWYYDNGLQLVLWIAWSDHTATGLVLERGRWMADLIAALPESVDTMERQISSTDPNIRKQSNDSIRSSANVSFAQYVLRDSEGEVVYRWGPTGQDDPTIKTLADVPLLPPLAGWNLAYEGQSLTVAWWEEIGVVSLLASLCAVVVSLLLLGVYVHTSFRRQILLAQQRVDFASHVSHELRTPLTNIRLYAELARRDLTQWTWPKQEKSSGEQPSPIDSGSFRKTSSGDNASADRSRSEPGEEGQEEEARSVRSDLVLRLDHRIQIIEDETKRLSRLVTGVLDLVSSNRRGERLRYSSAVIDEIISQVLASFRPALEPSAWEIELDLKAGEPVFVDIDLVELVLVNLISNVEKYAAVGRYLGIRSVQTGRSSTIEVFDRGPGIPRSSAKKVFRPFVRIDNSLIAPAGTGLGLAIARGAARRLGGDLSLENTGTGACFRFTLQHGPDGAGELASSANA